MVKLAAAAFATAKILDYSVARAARELCYIPLLDADKMSAKPVIDMFSYRFAKGFASAQLTAAVAVAAWAPGAATLLSFVVWFVAARGLGRRFNDESNSAA